jgi:hypothetical protein
MPSVLAVCKILMQNDAFYTIIVEVHSCKGLALVDLGQPTNQACSLLLYLPYD